MKYWVTVHGTTVEVEVMGTAVRVDGRPLEAGIEPNAHSAMVHLTIGGERCLLAAERTANGWTVATGGEGAAVTVETERTRRLRDASAGQRGGRGSGLIRAPMPGLVLRVEVAEGEEVAVGDGLMVLEAMKMENVIRASVGGRIKQVHVTEGTAVEKAALLVDIEQTS